MYKVKNFLIQPVGSNDIVELLRFIIPARRLYRENDSNIEYHMRNIEKKFSETTI